VTALRHVAQLAALAAALAACSPGAPRPNLLLVVVDTLRPDHLSCYGYERETTPNLDRLAAEGLRFTHAQSPRAKTTPAVASILTGLYPHDHGVRDLTLALDTGIPTLASDLRSVGYETAAIVGNYVLEKERSGLDRGFETWDERLPDRQGVPPDDVPQRRATSLTDGALTWRAGRVDEDQSRPWFLYLHYMDPHGTYDAPEAHRTFEPDEPVPMTHDEGSRWRPRVATYNVPEDAWTPGGDVDVGRVIGRYDAEVHYFDHEFGRLMDSLRARGDLEDTWVVVVADHGESFGEHEYWFEHGVYAFEATCRVPLIVRPPNGLRGRPDPGVRESDISLSDLKPTLLEWLDVRVKPHERSRGPRGMSRAELLERESSRKHPVFSEKVDRAERSRAVQTKAVRIGDHKLLQRFFPPRAPGADAVVIEELYDLTQDPREEQNLLLGTSLVVDIPLERLRTALEDFVDADLALPELARTLQEAREELYRRDPDAVKKLEALGY